MREVERERQRERVRENETQRERQRESLGIEGRIWQGKIRQGRLG